MAKVESFQLDHTIVKAPYVRAAGVEHDEKGSTVQKYDLRFLQPNEDALPTAAVHTLEHLLATYLRDEIKGIIDISPMGCRTGFYLILWNEHEPEEIALALEKTLKEFWKRQRSRLLLLWNVGTTRTTPFSLRRNM